MTSDRVTLAVPAHALPHSTPRQLLVAARAGLDEATTIATPGMRYATAHLAALRCAAAVLAARALPARQPGERSRVTSVWTLLPQVAPELTSWAEHFAAGTERRAQAEAGIPRVVTAVEADALLRSAWHFHQLVTALILSPFDAEAGA